MIPSFSDVKKFLLTPKDLSTMPIEERANLLALHFIGYVTKPTGISESLYLKCRDAFVNCTAGKVEREIEAILAVLKAVDNFSPDDKKDP